MEVKWIKPDKLNDILAQDVIGWRLSSVNYADHELNYDALWSTNSEADFRIAYANDEGRTFTASSWNPIVNLSHVHEILNVADSYLINKRTDCYGCLIVFGDKIGTFEHKNYNLCIIHASLSAFYPDIEFKIAGLEDA